MKSQKERIMRQNFAIQTKIFLVIMIFANAAIFAQTSDKVLANGDPPLMSRMVERYIGLMEWSLDVRFDSQDSVAVQKQLVKYWQMSDEKNIKGVLDTLTFEQNISNANEAKKAEIKPQLKEKLLETMEAESVDAMNKLLLGIYRKSQNVETENATNGDAGLNKLVGKWQVLHGNSIVGVDINSGRIGDGNAMIAEYDIKPDGRVIFSFVLQQSNFGCTTRIKTSKTGRIAVSGSRITFAYNSGTTVSEDTCNARHNSTKKLSAEKETFDFALKSENGKPQFCFANDKLKDCAVKIK